MTKLLNSVAVACCWLFLAILSPGGEARSFESDLFHPAPLPSFDSNGVVLVTAWQHKRKLDQPRILSAPDKRDSKIWRVSSVDNSKGITLRTRMTLPAGTYRLTEEIKCWEDPHLSNPMKVDFYRNSPARYAVERQSLDAQRIILNFQISAPRDPDEVELRWEIKSSAHEIMFDPSSLRLSRLPLQPQARE